MSLPHRLITSAFLAALLAATAGRAHAQGAPDHQYTSQDIEAGSRVYSSQCALCHGVNGDTVNAVNRQELTTPEAALQAFVDLRDSKTVVFSLVRGDAPVTLTIDVN